MKTLDLYGLEGKTIEDARLQIENALGVLFVPHDSLYLGEYYLADLPPDASIRVRINLDLLDGDPAKLEFPEISIIIEVDNAPAPDEVAHSLLSNLPEIKHLSLKTL